ncbi:SirB2 family protein [Oxalobacteraceae bacterium]|nr:SirB2 family protein [Oxalobacteraceae bacterium]
MDYLALKHFHMSCAALSGTLFLLRGYWMLRAPARLGQRWVRTLPHLVDSALLASAVTLAVLSGQSPFAQHWLGAKVLALLLYIGLGSVALKHGRSPAVRAAALAAACLVFGYIVAVALSKRVLPL